MVARIVSNLTGISRSGARPAERSRGGHPLLLMFLIVMFVVLPGFAHAAQVTIATDVAELRVGETITVQVQLVGGTADSPPSLPTSPELRAVYKGQSQHVVSVNLKTRRTLIYEFAVTGLKPGAATLGPARLNIGAQPFVSGVTRLQVRERGPQDSAKASAQASLEPGGAEGKPFSAFVGQTLVYHFVFRHIEELADAQWAPPEFQGLSPETTAKQAQKEYRVVDAGKTVAVHEIDIPLVVTAPGNWEVPPGILSAQFLSRERRRRPVGGFESMFEEFAGFGETRAETFTAPVLSLKARPLPAEDRPGDFSGLVGSFVVQSELGTRSLKVGDSTTLTITMKGDGTVAGLRLPAPAPEASFRFYDDQASVEGQVQGGRFQGTAVLKRAIVPLQAGRLSLPPLELNWFDPALGRYVVHRLPEETLDVHPGELSDAALQVFERRGAAPKQDIASLGDDILPIHSTVPLARFSPSTSRWVELSLIGVPGLALLLLSLASRWGRGDPRAARVRKIRRDLGQIPQERAERLSAMESLFRETMGLVLGLSAAAVDLERIRASLDETRAAEACRLYERLGEARYGGASMESLDQELRGFILKHLRELG